jgi:hypothetical protein
MKIKIYNYLLLVIAGLLFVLFIVKANFFFTEKPKVRVDYVSQYNQLSRPPNYKPDDNAAILYQKAFDAFIKMPDELCHLELWSDVNDIDKKMLENWLVSNVHAFNYLREAVDKPYYFIERVSSDIPPTMGSIKLPELNSYRELIKALTWNSRLNASIGQFQTAFEDLLVCYRSGMQKCLPNLLIMDQYQGLHCKNISLVSSFIITERYSIDSNNLKMFQHALESLSQGDSYLPGFHVEKLDVYDAIQRTFIDNGRGTGRWAWSNGWHISPYQLGESAFHRKYKEIKERLYYCLFAPDRSEVSNKIEELIDLSEQMMHKTPWQSKNESFNYSGKLAEIENSHIYFQILPMQPEGIQHAYYKTKAQTDALLAVLAILRYKNDTGRLPESLNTLVDAGYLKAVPNDPYSDGPLIYRLMNDNFKLYSVGEDFTDNGGITNNNEVLRRDISINVHTPDIVYWPIEIIEPQSTDFRMGEMF